VPHRSLAALSLRSCWEIACQRNAPCTLAWPKSSRDGLRVAKVIDWLKSNYAQPLRIEELASRVRMSSSSLHHHFRELTGMSPLPYQKWLRLNEARRLMLNEGQDAASAAFMVGYESPSQFSRKYSRFFGAPPKRDVEGLRLHGGAPDIPRVAAIGH
jgi:AraC-like DNA-binding protein